MSKPEINILRVFVLLAFVLYMGYFFSPYMYEYIYSEEVLHRLFSSPTKPIFILSGSLSWLLFVLHAIAAIMVYGQVRFSKYVYATVVLFDFGVASLAGIVSYTGLDMLLLTAINMLDAIVLYILFTQKSGRGK